MYQIKRQTLKERIAKLYIQNCNCLEEGKFKVLNETLVINEYTTLLSQAIDYLLTNTKSSRSFHSGDDSVYIVDNINLFIYDFSVVIDGILKYLGLASVWFTLVFTNEIAEMLKDELIKRNVIFTDKDIRSPYVIRIQIDTESNVVANAIIHGLKNSMNKYCINCLDFYSIGKYDIVKI